jgi:hypothetical protein
MAHASDAELCVLTALRLKSFAPAEVIAAVAGLDEPAAEALLQGLLDRGLAKHRTGALTGWLLTPDGRREGERRLADELVATGTRPAVERAYGEFLPLNDEMLRVCTDWQLLGGETSQTVNDHTDAAYDAAVIGRLAVIDEKLQPLLGELHGALERFGGYAARFAHALDRVRSGPAGGDDWADWFTKPTIDSYHTVWFELHENLLATLGIERSSEGR